MKEPSKIAPLEAGQRVHRPQWHREGKCSLNQGKLIAATKNTAADSTIRMMPVMMEFILFLGTCQADDMPRDRV